MAYRKVAFENAEWDVWDVRPQARMGSVGTGMENGWLCFQAGPRRRRLAPIPENWEQLTDQEIASLFKQAREVNQLLTENNERTHRSADQRITNAVADQRDRGQRGA